MVTVHLQAYDLYSYVLETCKSVDPVSEVKQDKKLSCHPRSMTFILSEISD